MKGVKKIEETVGGKVDGKFFDNKQRAKEYEAKIWFINEIYDLGFDKDIYGKRIEIKFTEYLRDEIKFETLDELKKQLSKDKIICEEIFTRIKIN